MTLDIIGSILCILWVISTPHDQIFKKPSPPWRQNLRKRQVCVIFQYFCSNIPVRVIMELIWWYMIVCAYFSVFIVFLNFSDVCAPGVETSEDGTLAKIKNEVRNPNINGCQYIGKILISHMVNLLPSTQPCCCLCLFDAHIWVDPDVFYTFCHFLRFLDVIWSW